MLTLERPTTWRCPHDAHSWVALQLAKMAAPHIRMAPGSISSARDRLERWMHRPGYDVGMALSCQEWLDLIDTMSPAEIADLLEEESENAARLRSSSPFIREPFFTEDERKAILERAFAG